MAQWEQMSFDSVPQNQSSSASCSTHTSYSPEKIPDSESAVVLAGEVATALSSAWCRFTPPLNTEKIGCSKSISFVFGPIEVFSEAVGEDGHVKSHVVSSSVMAQ